MLSAEGGVEIEQVAVSNPDAIAIIHVDPVDGLSAEEARALGGAGSSRPRALAIRRPTSW